MHRFSFDLTLSTDANTDFATFGFVWNAFFISDPFVSECSRFAVDPTENYGISREDADKLRHLNKLLDDAVEDALNAGCLRLQNGMEVETGDFAGIYFSGDEHRKGFYESFARYMMAEYQQAFN